MYQKIAEKFKSKEERDTIFGYFSVITGAASVVSLLSTLFLEKGDWKFTTVVFSYTFLSFSLSCLCIYLTIRYDSSLKKIGDNETNLEEYKEKCSSLEKDIENKRLIQKKTSIITHNICHEYRTLINGMYSDLISNNASCINDRERSFQKYMMYFLINIKNVFNTLTGDDCSVCIKMVVPESNGGYSIETFMRDPDSYRQRSVADRESPRYPYNKNTAFLHILSPDYPDNFFICNDLADLSANNQYQNINPRWKNYYNACLVVPIRISDETYKNTYICIWFSMRR